jgi:hypothetical protein
MSRESESEQPQRTVAELLAEYGNSGEGAPRRRRRRAEDDEDVSGAQAIIDRVNSDSGIMRAIQQDPQTGEPVAPASARSHRRLRPVGQQPAPQQPPARQAPQQQPPQPQAGQPRGPQQPPQPPPQQQSGAYAPTAYAQPVQPQAPNGQPPAARPGPQQNPPTGRQPMPPAPPSRPAMSPAQPPASRPPAPPQSRPAMPPAGPPSRGGLPPVAPGNAQTSRPAMPPVAPPGRVSPPLAARPPVDDYPDDDDFTEQGYGNAGNAPLGLSQQQVQQAQAQPPANPLQSRLGGGQRPEAAMTEELPPVVDDPPAQRPGQQTGTFRARPVMRRAPDSPLEATQHHPGPLESTQAHPAPYLDDEDEGFAQDEYEGEPTQYSRPPQPPPGPRNQSTQLINPNQLAEDGYPDEGYEHDGYPPANDYPAANDYPQDEFPARGAAADDVDLDSYDEPYERDRRDPRDRRDALADGADDLDDVPVSTGREWLVTAAQVGVGAIAGAAVWLGFSWLWGLMPIAAIVAAVVVVIGLIVVVRKWRKAEDLQTTVLAILAGLVVTVSPAALLLVRR